MNSKAYSDFLLSGIKPWAKLASGGNEVNCRCFYCQDSSNTFNGHFYISIPKDDTEYSQFYCQKCKAKGIVTSSTLLEWGIYDAQICTLLLSHNKKVDSNPKAKMKYSTSFICNIKPPIYKPDQLSLYKLGRINERLKTNLTLEDCKRLKIILNLKDLIKANRLQYTRDSRIVDQLDFGFVGFLSHDNAFLNMRNLDMIKDIYNGINKRYVNYNLINQYDNTKRFYTIPNRIQATNQPLRIHIAEGPFDILSIYLNLRNRDDASIYSTVAGSGYMGLIRYLIVYLANPFIELHIYPDNDIDDSIFKYCKNMLSPLNIKIYIHRNTFYGQKDFGVSMDKIKETIYFI